MRANRCSPPGEKNVSHFIFYLFDLSGTLTDNPDPTTILPPLTTKRPLYTKYYPRVQCNLISNTSAFFSYYHSTTIPIAPPNSFPNLPPPVSSFSPCVLLCFGEISAGNCESFTSCSHNGLWDYAKHSASAALPIDRRQRRPLEHTGKRWRALNEDVTAITQARFTDTLSVCSSSSRIPLPHFFKTFLFDSLLKCSLISCSSFIMHAHFEFA